MWPEMSFMLISVFHCYIIEMLLNSNIWTKVINIICSKLQITTNICDFFIYDRLRYDWKSGHKTGLPTNQSIFIYDTEQANQGEKWIRVRNLHFFPSLICPTGVWSNLGRKNIILPSQLPMTAREGVYPWISFLANTIWTCLGINRKVIANSKLSINPNQTTLNIFAELILFTSLLCWF